MFFLNTMTKQVTAGAADTPYYADHTKTSTAKSLFLENLG